MRKIVFLSVLFFVVSNPLFAQTSKPVTLKPTKQAETKTKPVKPEKKSENPKSGTYLKIILIHGDFKLYNYGYDFNDLNVEIERHWAKQHLGLGGFSIGYRKEDFSAAEYGHFFNSKVFWKAEKRGFYFKPGIGGEWGKPSPRFEQTQFHYKGTELVSYERISLKRNVWMPVGVKNTGTLNPFAELGIGQKWGPAIFEGGARIGYVKFSVNTFQFKNGDLTFQGLNGEYKIAPTLYVGIGLKMF